MIKSYLLFLEMKKPTLVFVALVPVDGATVLLVPFDDFVNLGLGRCVNQPFNRVVFKTKQEGTKAGVKLGL